MEYCIAFQVLSNELKEMLHQDVVIYDYVFLTATLQRQMSYVSFKSFTQVIKTLQSKLRQKSWC